MICCNDESDQEGEAQSNIDGGTVALQPVTGEWVVELRQSEEQHAEHGDHREHEDAEERSPVVASVLPYDPVWPPSPPTNLDTSVTN